MKLKLSVRHKVKSKTLIRVSDEEEAAKQIVGPIKVKKEKNRDCKRERLRGK